MEKQKYFGNFFRYLKYIIITLFFIVISKWIINFLPSSYDEKNGIKIKEVITQNITKQINIDITFKHLEPRILIEYEETKSDINSYIDVKINKFQENSKYRLSKEDGFLDWLFGWGTGYKLIWKKTKGWFDSEDNEIKTVEEKFKTEVILYDNLIVDINNYSKNRINDFYKSTVDIIVEDVNNNIKNLKEDKNIKNLTSIKSVDLPWGKYITQVGTNSFEVGTIFLASELTITTVVGSKVATILGPKVLGIVSAKAATIIAGKVASAVGLVFAPLIDYGLNEGVKALKIDETRKEFENAIDEIATDLKESISTEYTNQLIIVKNNVSSELNKQIKLKGEK